RSATRAHHDPLSFPTRRSSDLTNRKTLWVTRSRSPVDKSPMSEGCSWVGGRFAAMVARLRAGSCRRPCLQAGAPSVQRLGELDEDRKSTRLNSSHEWISYAVFC